MLVNKFQIYPTSGVTLASILLNIGYTIIVLNKK